MTTNLSTHPEIEAATALYHDARVEVLMPLDDKRHYYLVRYEGGTTQWTVSARHLFVTV